MSDVSQAEAPRRRPGRPRRVDVQQPQPSSDQQELPMRGNGRVQVRGRDGQVLTRKRTGNTDPYAIPQHLIPDGWDYQWNTYTVAGEQAVDAQILMAENGWRPVPAGRHPGMFMPADHPKDGHILRGGLRLEERPEQLTLEAREEERRVAVSQVRDQNAQLGLGNLVGRGGTRIDLGRGHEARTFLGQGQAVRTGVETSDAPRPRLEIDQ